MQTCILYARSEKIPKEEQGRFTMNSFTTCHWQDRQWIKNQAFRDEHRWDVRENRRRSAIEVWVVQMKDKTGCLEARASHDTGEPSVYRNRVLKQVWKGKLPAWETDSETSVCLGVILNQFLSINSFHHARIQTDTAT